MGPYEKDCHLRVTLLRYGTVIEVPVSFHVAQWSCDTKKLRSTAIREICPEDVKKERRERCFHFRDM